MSLPPLQLLDTLLNTPPRVFYMKRETFTGHSTGTQRIRSHRYIRVLRGGMSYTVDETEASLGAGLVIFVPRGALRHWQVPAGHFCEILWCEFDTPGLSLDPHALYYMDDSAAALEKQALERMLALWEFPRHLRGQTTDPSLPREQALLMEGELKASMARFWLAATAWAVGRQSAYGSESEALHPSVRRVLAWLEENFQLPDAQTRLMQEVLDLSPSHFRLRFREQVGSSVSEHLHRIRMREAMSLLRGTSRSVKEVAARVGFNDALYFSRRFHEHWGIPPSQVRK